MAENYYGELAFPNYMILAYDPSLIDDFYTMEQYIAYYNSKLDSAYNDNKMLPKQMHISDTPISFYDTVFYGCNKLEKVVLPQSVLTDSDKQYNLPVELNMFENLASTEKLKLNGSDKTTKLLGANINAKDASGADKPVTVLKKVQTGGGGSGSGGGGSSGGGGGGGGAATPVTPQDEVITLDKCVMHDAFINGYEDKTFKPNNKMTRAEFAKIMACISEDFKLEDYKDASSIIKSFGDIRDNYWYTPYIAFVIDKKIMNGYPEGDFKPEGLITRAEVSKVLGDIYNVPDKGIENTFLSELREDWFKDQADELIRGGIIKGYDDGTFGPKRNITRAEFVALINRVNGFTPDREIPKEIKDEFDKKFSDVREKD
ncbi:MAG: S-layer homology domain-containing protein [Clostridia bacterium]|nr:S-layer homology domain-containing protein [Clostridia bacterium]